MHKAGLGPLHSLSCLFYQGGWAPRSMALNIPYLPMHTLTGPLVLGLKPHLLRTATWKKSCTSHHVLFPSTLRAILVPKEPTVQWRRERGGQRACSAS